METVDILKILSYPIILGLAMIPGLIPLVWYTAFDFFSPCCNRSKKCLANTHTFSGGVFITMGLLHIFPESIVEFHEQYPELYDRFRIPEALFIFGYCLVLIFEKVICAGHHHCHHEEDAHHHAHGHSHDHSHKENGHHEHQHSDHHQHHQSTPQGSQKNEDIHASGPAHFPSAHERKLEFQRESSRDDAPLASKIQEQKQNGLPQSSKFIDQLAVNKENTGSSKHLMRSAPALTDPVPQINLELKKVPKECQQNQHQKKKEKLRQKNNGCCADSFIILSLSIHTFFQGLALGVLSKQSEVFSLLIGIILHNWAESLSIGAALAKRDQKQQHRTRAILLLFIYSILSPIGISIGWALLKFSAPIVAILASAVSGGTFLYIGATEVVNEDFTGFRLWIKSFYYLLGVFVIMSATGLTENTTEGHSH